MLDERVTVWKDATFWLRTTPVLTQRCHAACLIYGEILPNVESTCSWIKNVGNTATLSFAMFTHDVLLSNEPQKLLTAYILY